MVDVETGGNSAPEVPEAVLEGSSFFIAGFVAVSVEADR